MWRGARGAVREGIRGNEGGDSESEHVTATYKEEVQSAGTTKIHVCRDSYD